MATTYTKPKKKAKPAKTAAKPKSKGSLVGKDKKALMKELGL